MNEREIEELREKLLHLKSELQELGETSKESIAPVELDQTKVGRLSRMDAIQIQQMALETDRRRQDQLVKIEGALRRIESGEYGYCYVCGEEIVASRLSVDPTSTRCIGCVDT